MLEFKRMYGNRLFISPFTKSIKDIQKLSKECVTTNKLLKAVNNEDLWISGFAPNTYLPLVRERVTKNYIYQMYPLINRDLIGFTIVLTDIRKALHKYVAVNIMIAVNLNFLVVLLNKDTKYLLSRLSDEDIYKDKVSNEFYKESVLRGAICL